MRLLLKISCDAGFDLSTNPKSEAPTIIEIVPPVINISSKPAIDRLIGRSVNAIPNGPIQNAVPMKVINPKTIFNFCFM